MLMSLQLREGHQERLLEQFNEINYFSAPEESVHILKKCTNE